MRVVILGGGGHCKVVIDAMRASGQHEIVGLLTHGGAQSVAGVPVLGGDDLISTLAGQGVEGVFIAIGDNALRRRLFDAVRNAGLDIVNVIHPSAVIAPSVQLGKGVAMFANAVVNPDCVISDNVIVNTGATVDHDGRLGVDVHIAPGCHLAGNVTVGDRTFLGIGCVVIPDITIGRDVVAGAGTAIYRDLPDGCKVVGGAMRFLT